MAIWEKITKFKVVALAPFSNIDGKEPEIIPIDRWNLNEVINSFSIRIPIQVDSVLPSGEKVNLDIKKIKDFHPDYLINHNPVLARLLESVQADKQPPAADHSINNFVAGFTQKNLLQSGRTVKPEAQQASLDQIDSILSMVSVPEASLPLKSDVSNISPKIDSPLHSILNLIYNNAEFRALESTWRGLQLLLSQDDQHHRIEYKIAAVNLETITETLDFLLEELITDLPGLIIVDLPLNHSPKHLEIMLHIASIGETLMTPVIAWVSPQFFDMATWDDLKQLPYIPHHLDEPHYAKWKTLQEKPEARWLALTCNKLLARNAYGQDNPIRSLNFEESNPLWISPVWAAAGLILQSINHYGWGTRFMERNRIFIPDVPVHIAKGHASPTETLLSPDRVEQFMRAGFMPLISAKNKDIVCLNSDTVIGKVKLSYQLLVSGITHWIIQFKDAIEFDINPESLKNQLEASIDSFFDAAGSMKPDWVEVITEPTADNRIYVSIKIMPSKGFVYGSRDPIVLEFNW